MGCLQGRYAMTRQASGTFGREASMGKLCNAVGLPPVLCVFVVVGVCIGLLGIARSMKDVGIQAHGPASETR